MPRHSRVPLVALCVALAVLWAVLLQLGVGDVLAFVLAKATAQRPQRGRRLLGRRAGCMGDCRWEEFAESQLGDAYGAGASAGAAGGAAAALLRAGDATAASAVEAVHKWIAFLEGEEARGAATSFADASGYPLREALSLFSEELAQGVSQVVTVSLPEGFSRALGPVGLVAAVREGEDLDLSLFGEGEWETIHFEFLATNPLIGWSEALGDKLRAGLADTRDVGPELLQGLLTLAAEAGRAVTVSPLDEQLKEQYRRLGFKEDSLQDPTLMFWVPTEETRSRLFEASPPPGARVLLYGAAR